MNVAPGSMHAMSTMIRRIRRSRRPLPSARGLLCHDGRVARPKRVPSQAPAAGRQVRQRPRSAAAFTLVELLVVVAIIALLMTMLLPVLGHGQELARRAVCTNNLRQMVIAALLYASENRERFPPSTRDTGTEHASWIHSTLYETFRYRSVPDEAMTCPSRADLFALATQRLIDDLPDSHPDKDAWQQVVDNQGQDLGVRVGYYVLYGRQDTPWGSLNPWVSRQSLTDDDPGLAPLMVDVIEQGTHTYDRLTTAPHGPMGFVGPGRDPEAIGSAGGNVATVNGAVDWRPQAEMVPHASTATGPFPWGQSGYW